MRRKHTGDLPKRAADILWQLAEIESDAPLFIRCQAREMARALDAGNRHRRGFFIIRN